MLVDAEGASLVALGLAERRRRLESFAKRYLRARSDVVLSPATRDFGQARPLIKAPGFTGSAPGAISRWTGERSARWQPLEPRLVAEVRYDHFTGGRFRHATKLIRWRPDKAPRQCTLEQVERKDEASPLGLS